MKSMSHAEIKILKYLILSRMTNSGKYFSIIKLYFFMYILISFVAEEGKGVRRLANRVTKDHIHR